jgi:multidrug efflux pump subunit AcrB
VRDKEATPKLIGPLQDELNKRVPGAWITVRQLQTNPVETPVEVLITGPADTDQRTESEDIRSLRAIASQAMDIVRQSPGIAVLRDDWSPDNPQMKIEIDADRANLVGGGLEHMSYLSPSPSLFVISESIPSGALTDRRWSLQAAG